jgi:hypothetical protein
LSYVWTSHTTTTAAAAAASVAAATTTTTTTTTTYCCADNETYIYMKSPNQTAQWDISNKDWPS